MNVSFEIKKYYNFQGVISPYLSLYVLSCITGTAFANPTGGEVVQGDASIDYGHTTTINQSTDKAIINWGDFSVDNGEKTQFNVPSSNSVTLNRVTGGNPSVIMGVLKSNGKLFLVNRNGIVFGKNATVDVGGLVATTANISDNDFMQGNYKFSDAPDGSSIENYGSISIKDTGMAILVAPSVRNAGVISVKFGNIVLASGQKYTLDLYGDNLITFDASILVSNGLVENTGSLSANGGQILMTAQAADAVLESVISANGYIEATSSSNQGGKVVLHAHDNSTVNVNGNIDVSGNKQGETGGLLQIAGTNIQLSSDASIDASGNNEPGLVSMTAGSAININANLIGNFDLLLSAGGAIGATGNISIHNYSQTSGSFVQNSATLPGLKVHNDYTVSGGSFQRFAGGDGTNSPYRIVDFYGLNAMRYDLKANYQLASDIDGIDSAASINTSHWNNGAGFSPIGDNNTPFSGVFDGNNHNIGHLKINSGNEYVGLFGYTRGAILNNITLSNVDISSSQANQQNLGAIAGFVEDTSFSGAFNINNTNDNVSSVKGSNANNGYVGGLFGQIASANIASNFTANNNASVTSGSQSVGGIAGGTGIGFLNTNTLINNGSVSLSSTYVEASDPLPADSRPGNGNSNKGGNNKKSQSANGNNNTVVNGLVGGIFGSNTAANITFAATMLNTGDILNESTGGSAATGGIIGSVGNKNYTNNIFTGDFQNTGSITGLVNTGGIVGLGNDTSFLGTGTNTASVTGSTQVGGLIGQGTGTTSNISGTLSNKSTGTVTGQSYVGGVIGQLNEGATASAKMSNTASITGTGENIGGIIGEVGSSASVAESASFNNEGSVVLGGSNVGGMIGSTAENSTYNSNNSAVNQGNVTGTGQYIGGVAGLWGSSSTLSKAGNKGNVTGNGADNVGGVVGKMTQGTVDMAYGSTDSKVIGSNNVGGIVGHAGESTTVSNTQSSGKVLANQNAGGIVGYNQGSISNALGIGKVSANSNAGALIGNNEGALSGGLVDPTINAKAVAAGNKTGYTAPEHHMFTSKPRGGSEHYKYGSEKTYTSVGFAFAQDSWKLSPGFYASQNWCGADCQVISAPSKISKALFKESSMNEVGISLSSSPAGNVSGASDIRVEYDASSVTSNSDLVKSRTSGIVTIVDPIAPQNSADHAIETP